MYSASAICNSSTASLQPFADRKRPPLHPRDRNLEYHTSPSATMDDTPLPSSNSSHTAATLAALDSDDPFNTRKKASAVSADELPIGGSRAAQAVAPSYYEPSDSENHSSEHGGTSTQQQPDSSGASSQSVAALRRPPARARVKLDRSKPAGDREEEKDNSGQSSATVAAVEADDILLPRSSAATTQATLDTSDPFNLTKKKSSSVAMSDDAPLTGARSESIHLKSEVADESKEDSEQTVSQPIQPARRRPLPSLPSRVKQLQQRQQTDEPAADSVRSDVDGTEVADAESQPLSKRAAAPSNATMLTSAAASHFDDAPLPRSSAATLAAMLDTDDPFNSKKKSTGMALDDQPIGGSRGAQQVPSAWTDDSMSGASSAPEDMDHSQPPAATRRPPLRSRTKATTPAASAAADGEPQVDSSAASSTAAEDSSTSIAEPPRRPPLKAKQKADKDKSAAAASTAVADDKKKQSGAALATTSHAVKFDAYKGDGVMAAEEADEEITSAVSEATLALLQSKKWTEAVEGLQALTSSAEQVGPDDFTPHLPALMSVLSRSPTFKPANFNVCRSVYDCYAACLRLYIQSQQSSFNPSLAYHPLADVLSKLADAKVVDNACALLSVLAECVGVRFMYNHVAAAITKESFKSVKAIEAALGWLSATIEQFGVGSLDVSALIDQCALWMQSTSKAVKDSTLAILLTVYKQTGTLFQERMMLHLKPAAQKELEALTSAVPTELVGKLAATKWKKGDTGPTLINVDALVPRVDISGQVSDKLLKKLNDDNWKERKEAMDELEAALRLANHRILPKDGGALEVIGKWRLVDKNKNLSRDALTLLAHFCQAMGRPIATFRDKLVPNLFQCTADSKKLVKDEAMKTMAVWVETAGLASVAKYLPKALSAAGSRKELLEMMAASMQDERKLRKERKDMELEELIPPVIACMQDKTADVRVAAERVAELLARQVGVDALIDELKNLKKAEVLALRPVLDKIKKAVEGNTEAAHTATASQQQRDDEADERDGRVAAAGGSKKMTGKATVVVKGKGGGSTGGTLKKGAVDASLKAGDKAESESGSSSLSASAAAGVGSDLIKRVDLAAKSGRVKKDAKRVKGLIPRVGQRRGGRHVRENEGAAGRLIPRSALPQGLR